MGESSLKLTSSPLNKSTFTIRLAQPTTHLFVDLPHFCPVKAFREGDGILCANSPVCSSLSLLQARPNVLRNITVHMSNELELCDWSGRTCDRLGTLLLHPFFSPWSASMFQGNCRKHQGGHCAKINFSVQIKQDAEFGTMVPRLPTS